MLKSIADSIFANGVCNMKRNLTTGSVFKNIVYFSLPFFLSYLLQTLYGMADLFIIGRFCSVADITAVSVGSQVMHMLTVMIVGLAMGSTVLIGRNVGGENKQGISVSIGNTVTLFAAVSAVMTVLLLIFVNPVVSVMSTPAEAEIGAVEYLTVCFIGIPSIVAYNIISSIFRGLGDSKSPMYFVAISCVINILLDCVFIGIFDMGPKGAALGTVISQTVSVVIAVFVIRKRGMGISLSRKDFSPQSSVIRQIMRVGLPVSLQDGFIQIAFLVITVIANRRGLSDAAAVGIVEKIIGIFFLIPSSMLSSVSAIAAQNFGAGKGERSRLTLKYACVLSVGFGFLVSVITQFYPEFLVSLFTDDRTVTLFGGQYLKSYVWDCMVAGASFSFSGYFCALERSEISFIHNVLSILLVRIPVAYFMSEMYKATLYPMGLASPLGSLFSLIICMFVYLRYDKKWSCG